MLGREIDIAEMDVGEEVGGQSFYHLSWRTFLLQYTNLTYIILYFSHHFSLASPVVVAVFTKMSEPVVQTIHRDPALL